MADRGAPAAPQVHGFRRRSYLPTVQRMQAFTLDRTPETRDEIWLVEHPPVFTLGHASRTEHLRAAGDIPVVRTERGGQVTYHGPGQVVAYLLIDLHRRSMMVRNFVSLIEDATIALLDGHGVAAVRRPGAPGVYLRVPDGDAGAKIASLGIRVSRGCSYHGVALNVAMDLEPFSRIDPCGHPGLAVTDLRSCVGDVDIADVAARFGRTLATFLESKR
ncbi:MAG: lipoyl(octanoyl) transferase LipB [Burkholderiales bacterium]|nr:MAG: lipoyl(octanoyl) transferase LipB [Burkholderiales bacterium]